MRLNAFVIVAALSLHLSCSSLPPLPVPNLHLNVRERAFVDNYQQITRRT